VKKGMERSEERWNGRSVIGGRGTKRIRAGWGRGGGVEGMGGGRNGARSKGRKREGARSKGRKRERMFID